MSSNQPKTMQKSKDLLPTFEEIFKVVNTNMRILGLLPGEAIKMRFYVLFLALLLIVISELCYFYSRISPENFRDLLDLAPCISSGFNGLLKALCLAVNRNQVFSLIDRLEEIYADFSECNQKSGIAHKVNRISLVSRYYYNFCMILVTILTFWVVGIILVNYWKTREWMFVLPYPVLLPFPVDTWLPWLVVFTFSAINGMYGIVRGYICVTDYVTLDNFYFILTSQICNHFAIISDEILHLDKNSTKKIREIVIKHQYILQLSQELEEIFKASNLFSILIAILEICALEFNIATGDRSKLLAYMMFLCSIISIILMMSIVGDNLIRESRKVGEAAYQCDWYNMDVKSRKLILIIMMRAHKPVKLTAYKFTVICFESFTSIMSTSWSYFMLLRTVYTPPE